MPKSIPLQHHLDASAYILGVLLSDPSARAFYQNTLVPNGMVYPPEYRDIALTVYALMGQEKWRGNVIPLEAVSADLKLSTDNPLTGYLGKIRRAQELWSIEKSIEIEGHMQDYIARAQLQAAAHNMLAQLGDGLSPDVIKQAAMGTLANAPSIEFAQPMEAVEWIDEVFDSLGEVTIPAFYFQRLPLHVLAPAVETMTIAVEAPTGNRKSGLIMNWILEAAFQGHYIFVAPLESERRNYALSILAALTNEILWLRRHVGIYTDELTLRSAGLPDSGPIREAGEIAKCIMRERLAPFWQVVGMSDEAEEMATLERKIIQARDNKPDLRFVFIDPANYLIVRDGRGKIVADMFERTEIQARYIVRQKKEGLIPVWGWHTNASGGAKGGTGLPERLNWRIKMEYDGTPTETYHGRPNTGKIRVWTEKGREIAMGRKNTEYELSIDRASGLVVGYSQKQTVEVDGEMLTEWPFRQVCMIPEDVQQDYGI